MRTVLIALVVIIACVGGVYNPAAGQQEPSIVAAVTLTGANSHCAERSYHRITSTDQWVRVWQRHKGEQEGEYDFYYDPLGLPLVDFDRYMVIAIFHGGSRTKGAGVRAMSISEEEDRIVFRFDYKVPQTTADEEPKKGALYGFFVIARSTKRVALEENVQQYKGKAPEWKERMTFEKL